MASRFASNLSIAVLSSILVACLLTFRPFVAAWVMLGIGCAWLITVVIGFAFRGRGPFQRGLDVVVALIAVWTIVASRAFAGPTARWLGFSSAAALMALSVIGLICHEVLAERDIRWLLRHTSGDGRAEAVGLRPMQPPVQSHSAAGW